MKQEKCTRGASTTYWPSLLSSSPEELITRDHVRPMRTLVQGMKISITNAVRIMVSEDLRYKLMLWEDVNSCGRKGKGCKNGSRRTSQRCWRRRFGLPAHLNTVFWTILCGESLSYCSIKASKQNQRHHPEVKVVMGSLERGTVGKAC